jgi:hypothetical protein
MACAERIEKYMPYHCLADLSVRLAVWNIPGRHCRQRFVSVARPWRTNQGGKEQKQIECPS